MLIDAFEPPQARNGPDERTDPLPAHQSGEVEAVAFGGRLAVVHALSRSA